MKKNNQICKSLVVLCMVVTMILSSTAVFASEKYSLEEASKLTGYSVKDLAEYKKVMGDDFDSEIDRLIKIIKESSKRSLSYKIKNEVNKLFSTSAAGPVGSQIRSYTNSGDIHITSEAYFSGVAHGHSALALNSSQSLEIRGSGYQSEVLSISRFEICHEYALLRVNIPQYDRTYAATYGLNYLVGLNYNPLSGVGSSTVNCASLVAKTYKESGKANLFPLKAPFSAVLPYELVLTSKTNKVLEHNFPW